MTCVCGHPRDGHHLQRGMCSELRRAGTVTLAGIAAPRITRCLCPYYEKSGR